MGQNFETENLLFKFGRVSQFWMSHFRKWLPQTTFREIALKCHDLEQDDNARWSACYEVLNKFPRPVIETTTHNCALKVHAVHNTLLLFRVLNKQRIEVYRPK
jgi:hypothetical protein